MRILHLVLKYKWYDMIASGEKTEEYRRCKPYWIDKLTTFASFIIFSWVYYHEHNKPIPYRPYTHVCFHRAYTSTTMLVELLSISEGKGRPEWGAPPDETVFILKLGKIINTTNK